MKKRYNKERQKSAVGMIHFARFMLLFFVFAFTKGSLTKKKSFSRSQVFLLLFWLLSLSVSLQGQSN